MTALEDIYNNLPDNAVGDSIRNYIAKAMSSSETPQLRNTQFMGMVSGDSAALDYLRKHYPDDVKEHTKLTREALSVNYRPEIIMNNLGYKDYDDMFGKNGWTSLPEAQLNTLIVNAGLHKDKVKDFLKRGQAQYDRYKKYNSFPWKQWGFFAPRQHEAFLAGKEPSWKDLGGDLAENVLFALPVNRGIAYGTKGIKALGKLSPAWRNRANTAMYDIAGNAAVPFVVEGMDANLYDESENPERSSFNLKDAAVGATVNAAAPYALGNIISGVSHKLGSKTGSDKIAEAITKDPYVESIKAMHEVSNAPSVKQVDPSKANWKQERVDRTVLAKMEQNPEVLAQMGEQQYNDYIAKIAGESNVAPVIVPQTNEVISRRRPGDVALNTKRERILSDIQSLPEELKDVREANVTDFTERNPKEIYPSDRLSAEDRRRWGADESGNIGYVVENIVHVDPNHGIVGYVPADRSFEKLKEKAIAERIANNGDPYYHVWSEGDEALQKAMNKYPAEPKTPKIGLKTGLPTQVAKSFTTNKLGKNEFVKGIIDDATQEHLDTHNIPFDVRKELNDPMNIRMWEAKFVPNKIEGEPMWEAYKIWKKYQKNEDKNEKSR